MHYRIKRRQRRIREEHGLVGEYMSDLTEDVEDGHGRLLDKD